MGNTTIDYAGETWAPVVGCSHKSPGCDNCWAARLASTRLRKTYGHLTRGGRWKGMLERFPKRMEQPRRWVKPRTVFVCPSSDLFHEKMPEVWLDEIIATMADCTQHMFLLLTKRLAEARRYVEQRGRPLPSNTCLIASCENQRAADERIPALVQTPTNGLLGLSLEPLLAPINMGLLGTCPRDWEVGYRPIGDLISWVIIGGEAGHKARVCFTEWIWNIIRQCKDADVACYVKQLGAKPVTRKGPMVPLKLKKQKGNDPAEWPRKLRVRQMPEGW